MRKGEQTRSAILDAACELAARDGLEGLTIGVLAERMGFRKVASGPLVRSSYHARDMAEDGRVS